MSRKTNTYVAHEDLTPIKSLTEHFVALLDDCPHGHSQVTRKVTKTGDVVYIKSCMDCGARVQSEKGELTKARVESLETAVIDKRFTDDVQKARRLLWIARKAALFAKYEAHLRSPRWQWLRKQVLEREGCCVTCGARPECVHHVTYDRLFHEDGGDLVPLCHDCHDKVHNRNQRSSANEGF